MKMIKLEKNWNKKDIIMYVLSFFIPFFIVYLLFAVNGMIFGDYIVMRSDFIDSSTAIKEFARNIIEGNNIYFSFGSGNGLNNSLALSSCVYSPFNLLYLIFFNSDLNLITLIIISLKIGFSSLFFQLFSNKILKNEEIHSLFFSILYSLNAFAISYGTIHIMWLDSVMILPLLLYSLYKCIKENKRMLLIICYTYLLITHFYMGYMVGIFSAFVFLIYLFVFYIPETGKDIKKLINVIVNWVLCGLISAMISAFSWAPTLFFIFGNRVEDSTNIESLSNTIFSTLNSLFWGMNYSISGAYAYIYCGLLVLIFVPVYFINKQIKKNEKIFSIIIITFLFACTIITPLNTFMHVFDQPDYFWYRYSFIISFCLCSFASRTFSKKIPLKIVLIIATTALLFYAFMQHTSGLWQLYDENSVLNNNSGFVFNAIFIILWVLLWYLYSKNILKETIVLLFGILIICVEIVSNSCRVIVFKKESNDYYNSYNYIDNVVTSIKDNDNGLYRMICVGAPNYSSDTMFGYWGITDFGNQERYQMRKFLSNIGFASSTRITSDNGFNPVSNMLLGIKYVIKCPDNLYGNIDRIKDFSEVSFDENDKILNIGYLVSGSTILYEYPGRNVFENLNSLVSTMSEIEDECFVSANKEDIEYYLRGVLMDEYEGGAVKFDRYSDVGTVILFVNKNNFESAYTQFEFQTPMLTSDDYYVLYAQNLGNSELNYAKTSSANMMSISDDADKYYIELYSAPGTTPNLKIDSINTYYLDEDVLSKQYEELSKNQLIVNEWSNGHIRGTIHVDNDKRLLFTSIQYDPGWHAYVNGRETDTVRLIDGTFMGIYLPGEGDYSVEFKYEVPGLRIGFVVTILGIIAFLSVIFEKKLKKPKNVEKEQ